MKMSVVVLALLVFAASCAHGVKITDEDLQSFQVGKTTKRAIREKFGEPRTSMSNAAGSCDFYIWHKDNKMGSVKTDTVQICYDKKGLLNAEPTAARSSN